METNDHLLEGLVLVVIGGSRSFEGAKGDAHRKENLQNLLDICRIDRVVNVFHAPLQTLGKRVQDTALVDPELENSLKGHPEEQPHVGKASLLGVRVSLQS